MPERVPIGPVQEKILGVLLGLGEASVNIVCAALEGKLQKLNRSAIFLALDRMANRGLVSSRRGEPVRRRGGKAQILFAITDAGRREYLHARDIREAVRPAPSSKKVLPPSPSK